jgi:hypothetical protein
MGFKFSWANINKRGSGPDEHGRIDEHCQRFCSLAKKETALATKPNEGRARAEASFRKEERAKEGAKAMMEYQANSPNDS